MTYLKLLDSEYKTIKEIQEITNTDYEVGDFIKVENLISIIEDLKLEYDDIKVQFENYKENIEENYILKEKDYE
jgi:hypothetical protein